MPVSLGVGAGMRFLAMQPEDLGLRLLDDFALFLDCRRVDPIFGVEDASLGCAFGG